MTGTFSDGTFSDGMFSEGTFSDGTFRDGTFSDGMFCMRTGYLTKTTLVKTSCSIVKRK